MMGIEHFVLYDNGLEIGTQVILNPYIENGLVSLIPFPDIPGLRDGRHADTLSIQQMAYADCIIRFKHHFTYLLQLDIDEFLFPKKYNSITEVLNEYDDSIIARIEINWTNFGDSGYLTKPNGWVIKNFIRSGGNVVPQTIKSISNARYLSKKSVYTNVHRFSHCYRLKEILTKLIWGYPQIIKGKVANDLFQLNHYCTKSKKEFLVKGQKTKKGMQKGMKTKEIYIKLNNQFNHVEDKTIFRFIPKLENILNKLSGLEHNNY